MTVSDDEDALEAEREFLDNKKRRGQLFRRPRSPKVCESSDAFLSSPVPRSNPFLLEDDVEDENPYLSARVTSPRFSPDVTSVYTQTIGAKTSNGRSVRIGRRKRMSGRTVFDPEIDMEHESKTKYFGLEIHTLLSELQAQQNCTPTAVEHITPQSARRHSMQTEESMWVDKYRPQKFTELLGDERTNRDVMRWIKHWDFCVFGRAVKENVAKQKQAQEGSTERIFDPYTDPHNRPERKILLLTGPPGFGKTTLAHIAARQAGYNVIEINASDDRTGAVVQSKIGDALDSQAIFNPRPTLVVIDEIDGVSNAGGEAGFIRTLLKFITDDEKTTATNKSQKSGESVGKRKGKRKSSKALLRPIICICNDQYVAALRPLRPYCQILNFRPLSVPTVVARLRTICHTEGLQADVRALNALCEITESDLRSCVNSLQYVRMKTKNFTLETVSTTLAKRDTSRSAHSVVESVFKLLDAKQERKKGLSKIRSDNIGRIADLALTNNEFSKILNGCFAHYPNAPYHDNLFSKPAEASDWLFFYDQCEKNVYEKQNGELANYMPYPVAAFHHLFATHESRSTLERSKADWEAREKLRINSELLGGWIGAVKATLRQLFNPTTFATELLSYGMRIIGTNLNPANTHLIKAAERAALARVVDAMLGMGMQYVQYRIDDGSYIFRLEPPLTQVLNYDEPLPMKGESLLPSRYAARQIISAELSAEKIRRSLEAQGLESSSVDQIILPKTKALQEGKRQAVEELPAQPPLKKDFFGRPLQPARETTQSSHSNRVPAKQKPGVHVKFADGFSDAVRNNISIRELLGR